ncbi:MAG TPA: thiamine pyrophosphate-binding protein [Actinomycetota bacterium]|nr:thiamine pyrophosphate-binding protein [Actinomycetota bacterium]
MKVFAAELLVDRLADWGVDTVFGLPGEQDEGIPAALAARAGEIRLVRVQHEEAAAFMATGYAKATGRPGVCLATSGPGAVHLLNGLYDAKLDHQPVLAVTELEEGRVLGTAFHADVHLDKLFEDVAGYNVRVNVPVQIPAVVDIALGHAVAKGTVSHITFPPGLDFDAEEDYWVARTPTTAPVFLPSPGVPPEADLERAAATLNQGARRAVLVGVGAFGARSELLAVAERLASPIVKSLPGKATVPDDHPLCTGCIGALGTRPAEEALAGADALLVVGTNFPWTRHLPDPGKVRTVQIETDLTRVGAPTATEAPLVGDAAETLQALLPLLHRAEDRSFLDQAQHGMARWRERLATLEDPGTPVRPRYLARVVDRLASSDAILASDSGSSATWSAHHFDVRAGRHYLLSANLTMMTAGLPYAIAAQWAHPSRQVIAFVAADGFAKLMAELLTAVHHQLPVKVVVANPAQPADGHPPDFARWAGACGALGARAERADEVPEAISAAFAHPGPAVVDVLVGPDEPERAGATSAKE